MSEIEATELTVLRAAIGWLELKMPQEALAELDRLPVSLHDHPDVLEVRWIILADLRDWEQAVAVTTKLVNAAPDRSASWLHHAYATRRASEGGLLAAFNILAPVAHRFSDEPTIPYNLACYTCQLGRGAAETMDWLEAAFRIGEPKAIVKMALEDADLEPVRGELLGLATKLGVKNVVK